MRAVAWERRAHEQIAGRIEPLSYGFAAIDERCFAVHDGDDVIAFAKLHHRDAIAQVEDVVVLEGQRGAGLGRTVTTAALAAGLDLEPELMFIVADEDDWPKQLYERLGFQAAGRTRMSTACPRRCSHSAPYGSVRRPPAKSRASRT